MKFKQLNESTVKVGTFIGWNEKSIGERTGAVVVAEVENGYILYQGDAIGSGDLKDCVNDAKKFLGTATSNLMFMTETLMLFSEEYRGNKVKVFKSQDEFLSWLEDY